MAEVAVDRPSSETGPVHTVPVGSVRIGGTPRSAGENLEHIRTLADTSAELPPIIVHRRTMRVIDGVHRLRAARLRGERRIAVRFFDGTDADAFVVAVRTNIAHGLPLTLADRKAAAARIVASHPRWSDRMIASAAGLSAATVARVRRELPDPEPTSRIGTDGRIRPVNSLERRRLARALLLADPNLSLREVARRAGISPETARNVRNRLRGEDSGRPGPAAPPAEPPPSPVATVRRLRADPALRFTETGRALLRLLDIREVTPDRWAAIVDTVPAHARTSVAAVALECAKTWQSFAEQLEQRAKAEAG